MSWLYVKTTHINEVYNFQNDIYEGIIATDSDKNIPTWFVVLASMSDT